MHEVMAAQPIQEHQLNQELRIRTDTETWLAETLNGNMRTTFEFSFDGQELHGEDSGGLTEVFDDSIREAKVIAQENPSLLFELRRRLIEREELDEMKAMASGELGDTNTIVVVSDFPPELMASKQDVGRYNTNRKQTMLRVITLEQDSVCITTQSLDGSNRQALEAIYNKLGQQPEPGELLGQRIHLDNLPAQWQPQLIDNLTDTYDNSLREQFGGEWYGGRKPADDRNTYDFVRNQRDLIDWFTRQKLTDPIAAEKQRFKLAATAEARFGLYSKGLSKPEMVPGTIAPESFITMPSIVNGQSLQVEMARAEHRASRLGKTYSGCGASVSAEIEDGLSTGDQIGNSGYGNKSGSDRYGSRKFKCPNGHENTRPRNQLLDKCGKCGVSVRC